MGKARHVLSKKSTLYFVLFTGFAKLLLLCRDMGKYLQDHLTDFKNTQKKSH